MIKNHCNICDKTPADDKKRLWPNFLPEGHKLRNIALDVTLVPDSKKHYTEDEFHLCQDCWTVLILSVAAAHQQFEDEAKALARER